MSPRLLLIELDGAYGIGRLGPSEVVPDWVDGPGFVSISRSDEELSVVCRADRIPEDIRHDTGWTCFKFQGPFDFGETGIMLSVIKPLSEEGVGVFVVSTFDTDYLLVKAVSRVRVGELLAEAGHTVR
jgi:hypothetical protein